MRRVPCEFANHPFEILCGDARDNKARLDCCAVPPAGVIGYDFFANFTLVVDRLGGKMTFVKIRIERSMLMKLPEERAPRFEEFRQWLDQSSQKGEDTIKDTIKTIVGRCKRVERALRLLTGDVDLDAAFERDGLEAVLRSLDYFVEDVHNRKEPPAGLVFKVRHNDPRYYEKIKEGLNSLHTAVGLYRNFAE